MHRALGLLMLSVMAACSPVTVLNALAPRDGIAVHAERYADGERGGIDVYTPDTTHPAPVILFLYGGGWVGGDRGMYRFVAANLAAKGFVVAVPDYRLYPQVRFPAFLTDGARALSWTRSHIAAYGGDPGRIYLMGHSAGAYIAAMLTLDRQWLAQQGMDPDRDIAGMIGLAGPYDFLPLREADLIDIFSPARDLRLTQPVTFARGDAPPMLLMHGEGDDRVWPRNTIRLSEAIRADGGRVEERLYPRVGHSIIVGAVARPLQWLAPVMDDVATFVNRGQGVR